MSRWKTRNQRRQLYFTCPGTCPGALQEERAGAVDTHDRGRRGDRRRIVRLAVFLRLVLGARLGLLERELLDRDHALGDRLAALRVHREHHLAVGHLEAELLARLAACELE